MSGLVHIYTGNGKGKTTAAIGLGIRAYGNNLKVLMIQFLKSFETGELKTIEELGPDFTLYREKSVKGFYWNMSEGQKLELKKNTQYTFDYAVSSAMSGEWDLLILDEIMGTLSNGLIGVQTVAELIKNKPDHLELVLTGRNAPKELVDLADYVSEINAVKHPMDHGVSARKGIEY